MNNLNKVCRKGPNSIINYPLISLIKFSDLELQPTRRCKVLSLYKRFFKLRHLAGDKQYKREIYVNIISRRFRFETFEHMELRRSIFLPGTRKLTEKEAFERIINTLAFVFNATVYEPSNKDENVIGTFKESQRPKRVETQILDSIIGVDQSMPIEIKYDRYYRWLLQLDVISEFSLGTKTSKDFKRVFLSFDPNLLGYRNYEVNLLRLNETAKLYL